jgi:hypothetical protein
MVHRLKMQTHLARLLRCVGRPSNSINDYTAQPLCEPPTLTSRALSTSCPSSEPLYQTRWNIARFFLTPRSPPPGTGLLFPAPLGDSTPSYLHCRSTYPQELTKLPISYLPSQNILGAREDNEAITVCFHLSPIVKRSDLEQQQGKLQLHPNSTTRRFHCLQTTLLSNRPLHFM